MVKKNVVWLRLSRTNNDLNVVSSYDTTAITTWIHRQVLITINLLNIAQQMTPSLLLEATRTQLCQTTVLAVFVASDTKSIAQVRKTISLSAANKPGQSMYSSEYLFYFPPNFFCTETTALFCSFRASLPLLKQLDSSHHSIHPLAESWTKLKWWMATILKLRFWLC